MNVRSVGHGGIIQYHWQHKGEIGVILLKLAEMFSTTDFNHCIGFVKSVTLVLNISSGNTKKLCLSLPFAPDMTLPNHASYPNIQNKEKT